MRVLKWLLFGWAYIGIWPVKLFFKGLSEIDAPRTVHIHAEPGHTVHVRVELDTHG